MADLRFLALDLGAESGRAMLGTLAGGRLALAERHRFANTPVRLNGHLHWNLPSLWQDLKTGLRQAAGGEGEKVELAGIGVDTWGVDFAFLDGNGDLLGLPYVYRDGRTEGMLDVAFDLAGREEIFRQTGIQIMQINSLYQVLSMAQRRSPILDAARTLLFMPDLFHYLFTGIAKVEFSIASTSQMYDMGRGAWATDLLRKLGIPTGFLGEVVPCGTMLGPVRPDVAEECGVGSIPVITPGSHDTASAVAAVPAEGEDWCYISSGTWSLMGVELPRPIINDVTLRHNFTNEGGIGGSIRLLKNCMGLWLVQECRRQWQREGIEYDYAKLTALAAGARPFAAIINPDHPPFLAPGDMPRKIEQFCRNTGQDAPRSHAEMVRSCLESLALTYRKIVEGLEEIQGRPIRTIHIVGGGSRNELLNQMTADACGRTVVAGPVEATAAGNILCQAIATGHVRDLAAARAIIRASFDVKRFEPRDSRPWDAAYSRYRELVA